MQSLLLAFLFMLSAAMANAEQKFLPLLDLLPESQDAYPFVRCAALYSAALTYAEERGEVFDTQQDDVAADKIGFHIVMARLSRSLPVDNLDDELDPVVSADIDRIMDLYLVEMENAASHSGSPMNEMLGEDLAVCQAFERKLK